MDRTFDVIASTLSVLQGRVRDLEYEISRKDARHKLQVQELLTLKEFLQARTDELSHERDLAQQYRSDWAQLELHCHALEDRVEEAGHQRPSSPFFESQFPSWKASPVRRALKRSLSGLPADEPDDANPIASVSRTSSVEPDDLDDDARDGSNYETQVDATWRVISAGAPTFKKRRLYEN